MNINLKFNELILIKRLLINDDKLKNKRAITEINAVLTQSAGKIGICLSNNGANYDQL